MRLARCRPVALLLAALHLSACTYWQPSTVAPRQLIEDSHPSEIRVTREDGGQIVVRSPELRGDSVVTGGRGTTALGLLVSDIRGVEVRRISPGRTVGLVVLIGVVSLAAVYTYLCIALCGSS